MPQDSRRLPSSSPAFAHRPQAAPALDFEELFATGEGVNTWEALKRQPIAALVRPPAPDDEKVPVVRMSAGCDLDTIAQEFAAGDAPAAPAPRRAPID